MSNTATDIIKKLSDTFGEAIAVERNEVMPVVAVDKALLVDVLTFLKTEGGGDFAMLTDLFPVDYMGRIPRFDVVYLLSSLSLNVRIVVKTFVDEGGHLPTVSNLWKAADWMEREAYDMFGIVFDDHPDLRRILMVEDFEGHPLRKDYPVEGYDFEQPFIVNLEEEKT